MAKVKQVKNGRGKRDVVADLIGGDRPRKTKVVKAAQAKADKAAKAAKAGKGKVAATVGRAPAFDDDQTIKVLKKHPGGREGSNVTLSVGVLQSGMTVKQWQKARTKAGVENPGFGVLRSLVNDGYVRVK